MAEQYAGQKVGSVFVYANEAHPGEYYPHLTSMEQKYRHAADLRDKLRYSNAKRPPPTTELADLRRE